MKPIVDTKHNIYFGESAYSAFDTLLKERKFSKILVLVDENTNEHCMPVFLDKIDPELVMDIIEIEAGEYMKIIETCASVWDAMSELGAERQSLLVNLGGGVITDLGGFVASAFKRGISFVNVPTSLLAMVDAAIGGKTGVDLGHLKNQIGLVNTGEMVLIDIEYLGTLPEEQMRSGMAEMFKHGLIADEAYWEKMSDLKMVTAEVLEPLIYESVHIKHQVVSMDLNETGLRKSLNYGHTLGHAIESHFLELGDDKSLLHGEAIAIGMVMESYISHKLLGFPLVRVDQVKTVLSQVYGKVEMDSEDRSRIIELLKFDKKNTHGQVNFVLLEDVGRIKLDCQVPEELIIEAFEFYDS